MIKWNRNEGRNLEKWNMRERMTIQAKESVVLNNRIRRAMTKERIDRVESGR
jgi:hypothetical protein